jgi:hypothetical protein
MRQRKTTPARLVGKCKSTRTDGPDRLSCSISTRGAERANANEMQGTEPATTYGRSPTAVPRPAISADVEHALSFSNMNIDCKIARKRFDASAATRAQ